MGGVFCLSPKIYLPILIFYQKNGQKCIFFACALRTVAIDKGCMNYRHAYHAGNFADVIKHLLLVLCIDRLKTKPTPFFVLDAHGGTGLYDLTAVQAQKTMEYQGGVGRLMRSSPPALCASPPLAGGIGGECLKDLNLYLSLIKQDWDKNCYPGSPLLAARMLRPQDRLLACELHPEDFQSLKAALEGFENVKVMHQNAYQALRAYLPPRERRGLVLIDPPYEIEKNEFSVLAGQLQEWRKRWATATYLLWYPVKAQQPPEPLFEALNASGFKDMWRCEWELIAPPDTTKLRRTGIVLINPPHLVPKRLEALAPMLEEVLQVKFYWNSI
jgi:23S rRNA (adenine2030-N6)-methyltransferase